MNEVKRQYLQLKLPCPWNYIRVARNWFRILIFSNIFEQEQEYEAWASANEDHVYSWLLAELV